MLNKAEALSRLKAKLIAIAQDQALADFNEIKGALTMPHLISTIVFTCTTAAPGDQVEATFGQQIRNYVFAPYKMVKDTRTGYETAQVTTLQISITAVYHLVVMHHTRRKTLWTVTWMGSLQPICVPLWTTARQPATAKCCSQT